MKTLGIITTTYNRDYSIHQVYESLLKQKNKDFKWLVIDDGSTDDTEEIIQNYINENKIEIEYIFQENKGMTQARNLGYENIDTEINTMIDSDDWLEDDAVEKIINFWNENKNDKVSGIIALNERIDGEQGGKKLPEGITQCTYTELHDKYNCTGDKKLIFRTDLSKEYPYPKFEGEKNFPASYKFRLLDLKYEMLLMDEVVCIVDFNENGATFQRVKQYQKSPKSYAFYRNEMMRISNNHKFIFKQALHYISSSKFANNKNYIKEASKKFHVIVALPLGLLFNWYIKNTKKKSLKHKVIKKQ